MRRGNHAGGGFAVEGSLATGHFVEDGTKRKDIAARVGVFAFDLFG
ncbi:MAG TPA: hypothetical protein VH140_10995 [Candidatus Acidoferrum sp.]|nr:hypothetical protein [Candidatus Acidoferrum sp.]